MYRYKIHNHFLHQTFIAISYNQQGRPDQQQDFCTHTHMQASQQDKDTENILLQPST